MFHFNWKLTLFVVLMLPLLVQLGFWQLAREQEKRGTQLRFEERGAQAPTQLHAINWQADNIADVVAWLPVRAQGIYDEQRQFLLDNRINQSRVGYEVITPMRTSEGLVMVNRGWLAQGPSRQILPDVGLTGTAEAELMVTGTIYVPEGEIMMLGGEEIAGESPWPQVIQRLDMAQIQAALGEEVLPFSLRLDAGAPGALQPNWQPVTLSPETHRAYAVQWFFMAVVLAILYLIFSFRRPEM